MRIKIATVGSCVTRDNFNQIFNSNHRMFFDLVLHQHQVSIPSHMSNPIPYREDSSVSDLPDFGKWHLKTECNKEFLELIKERKPSYLLMDLYGDVYFGVSEIAKGEYFTNNPKFANISFLKKYDKKLSLQDNPDAYFEMWKPKVDEFFAFLNKEVPHCKVILVKARFTDTFEDGSSLTEIRKEKNIRFLDVNYMNTLWDKLDQYIIETFNVLILDMTEKSYYLDENHPWGAFYLHYKKDFYHDFLNKLINLITADMHNEIEQFRCLNKELLDKVNLLENESVIKLIRRKVLKISS